MHPVLLKVQIYLDKVNRGEATMPDSVLEEASRSFRKALDRQFNRSGPRNFRLRMSNVGGPICQLWHQKHGTPAEPEHAFHPMKMTIGDAVEIIAIAIMRSAGVNITGVNEKAEIIVRLHDGEEVGVYGRTDVCLDERGMGPETYDVKSASSFAYQHKFSNPYGYENLHKDDPWGYIAQAFGYEEGTGTRFAGWIAVNKETGEWTILDVPEADREVDRKAALEKIESTVRKIESEEAFPGRQFEAEPEMHRGKPTGRMVLGQTCSYCPFKWTCWPGLSHERKKDSIAKNPKWVYYVPSSNPTESDDDGARRAEH